MNSFFSYAHEELLKKKNHLSIICISFFLLTLLAEAVFIIVQNRSNSLVFFILMLLLAVVVVVIELILITFILPIINQLIYLAKRKEQSPNTSYGKYLREERNLMFRHLEVTQLVFLEDDTEIIYYALKDEVVYLTENHLYQISHANQFLFEVKEENENQD